jgi:myb proto-oncogene protein
LGPNIGGTSRRKGKWIVVEDSKLKDAVQTHGAKDWDAISTLVPGRTEKQCRSRWKDVLEPSINQANGCTGKWTVDEDSKLKDAVQTHDGRNGGAIAALVSGRTEQRCRNRWKEVLDPSIDRGSTGKWTAVEDSKLKDAVQTHGAKDWDAISALVPGRTRKQCNDRWHDVLDPSNGRASGRSGKWTAVEYSKLKDAVQTYGDKGWIAISALVLGRTRKQCNDRWRDVLDPSNGRASGRSGEWTAVEDSKLKDAVHTYGDKG